MLIYGQLNLPYSILVNIMTIIGTLHGIKSQKALVAYSGGKNQNNILVLIANIAVVMMATAALIIYEMS